MIFMTLSASQLISQGICSGNLGENIFEDGDFGSGSAAVVQNNPNIAPGYNYTTQVPFDGSYVICSRTNALSGLFPTWLSIQDNSPDPNGYMMVVNANYSPGIFYEETVDNLCENTLYEFSADIINLIRIGIPDHIDPNVTFLIDDVVVYETGNIPKTEEWVKFGFSFITNATQSSVKLSLRNNAPGGSGNDLALDNISFRACGPSSFIGLENESTSIFLCVDDEPLTVVADILGDDGEEYALLWQSSLDSIIWDDVVGSSTSITHTNFEVGTYYYRYLSSGNEINLQNEKCRIISDILKIIIIPETYMISDTTCIGETYQFGDQELTSSGDYTETFISSRGCDSVVFLDLLLIPNEEINISANITDPSCYEFTNGSIVVSELSGGYGGLSFDIYDSMGQLAFDNLSQGNYKIVASDRFNCTQTLEVELIHPAEVKVDLGPDTMVRLGQEIIIDPDYQNVNTIISWIGDGAVDCNDCQVVNYLPSNSGYLSVIAEGEDGCTDTDSIFVTVDEQNLVYFPNIFSPNDDRMNDFMTINYFGRSVEAIEQFTVFDRWGNIIYTLANTAIASGESIWDGYSQNKIASNGVYFYHIRLRYINGKTQEIINNITVLR